MKSNIVNKEAIYCLENQNWQKAQELFLQNARDNPSHETYNNLGYYLICEGYICKNGKIINAHQRGMKYLQQAKKLKSTPTNLCAIATAYDFELRYAASSDRADLHRKMYELLSEAYSIMPVNEIQYNILRMRVLMNAYDATVLQDIRLLLTEFICEESVRLYFEVLRYHSLYDEGMNCIAKYGEYLLADDVLLFYAKHQKYEEGYALCDAVCHEYSPNKYTSAAIIECCVNTNHFEEVRWYQQYITEVEESFLYNRNNEWLNRVFLHIDTVDSYRKKLISGYSSIPPFLVVNGYFQDM